ncbi:MAG TPA: bile acid:sodium symporter family protein [Chitinophagales bacterium]|nr:bile acid:sodium symporter family protein [Chitinophagales bacterium]
MEQSSLLTIVMPIALGIIMLGLGLSLTTKDFTRVVKYPKAMLVGLFCQMILLPIVCFFVAKSFGLTSALAVGLMLLSASPGGAVANLYSHLSNGDVALNVSLTAVNSVLSLFTLPLIVNLSLEYFMNDGQYIPIQFKKVIEVFAIVLVPVLIGMVINQNFPSVSKKLEKPVKIASALILALVIIAVVGKEKDNMLTYFQQVGLAALAFNVISMAVGYLLPRLLRVDARQAIAIGMEVGIHNGTLAIYIAMNVIGNETMAIPPAIYSIIMFFTAAAFGMLISRLTKPAKA